MIRWIGDDDEEEWTALFTGYQASAYRQECQQIYTSTEEDASLARFLSGRPVELDWTWLRSTTRRQIAAGRTKTQVRIVVEPPTQYTQLELTLYPEVLAAGGDVRIIAVRQGDWPDLPHHDFWLFDDRDVWRLHYHENFRFKGAELLDDPEVVAQHRQWRDTALALAVPFVDYLAPRQQLDDQECTTA